MDIHGTSLTSDEQRKVNQVWGKGARSVYCKRLNGPWHDSCECGRQSETTNKIERDGGKNSIGWGGGDDSRISECETVTTLQCRSMESGMGRHGNGRGGNWKATGIEST